jgi:predicted metal-dependent hydrolase
LAIKKGVAENPSQWKDMIIDFKRINQKPNDHEVEVIYQKLPRYQETFKNLYLSLQNLT